ncbi:hypothetical protein HID58_038037 [Brassica napus]|uniref:SGS domain-containing protein n=1 Tax=Brassica napus TaxID=3708 RepID=A0ABQ8BN31_BRANA|nr:hypothetical protein HID58_038037 [Brassica napus]
MKPIKCDRLKHNAFSEHISMINTSIIVTDVPREKAYHLKPRLFGKIAVVKCRYEVISTKIKRKVSMRPAYRSSKKVLVNDKLEAEKDDKLEGDAALNKFFYDIYLNSDEDMRSSRANHMLQCFGILIDSFAVLHNQQVESNGTVLSIDWKDVSAKKIESTLHDDLALKTWEI